MLHVMLVFFFLSKTYSHILLLHSLGILNINPNCMISLSLFCKYFALWIHQVRPDTLALSVGPYRSSAYRVSLTYNQ